jgi:hypothetical protein
MGTFADTVVDVLGRGGDPANITAKIVGDLEGLKERVRTIGWNNPQQMTLAVNAIEHMQSVMDWENVKRMALG